MLNLSGFKCPGAPVHVQNLLICSYNQATAQSASLVHSQVSGLSYQQSKAPIINVSTPFFSVTAPFCLGNNSTKQGYSHKITYGICMCFHVARQYVHTVYKTANINTCLKSDSFLRMELARSFAPYMQFLLMSSPFRTFRFVAMQVTGRLRLCSVYSYLQTSKKPSKL